MRTFCRIHLLLAISSPMITDAVSATIPLRPGLVITSSVSITPRTYRLQAPGSLDSAVVIIRGNDITVDFSGATMEGIDPGSDPDLAAGVAVLVDGGKNIRILHAHIRGYKIGILARNTENLQLIGNDVSYNWKPRLFSLVEHESLLDWLSFHHNENNEWLRYGGGIFLSDVSGGTISGNRAVQQMNGLLMTRCDQLRIEENNFSFNSGLGIGLYRSSYNVIAGNRIDYNVRGYNHRFFRRGQDSAGLLVYEQSSHNIIAYNSVTHGGDGLFIWAGQTTMDSGKGGVNDNLIFKNDFSFAPANGIEATFSRNTFVGNRADGCEYGLWGGYSFESKIIGNMFRQNRFGIAIEHGQDNRIVSNIFEDDTVAISLWANPIEPSDWGYPKYRDTRSRDCAIESNLFSHHRIGIKALNTINLSLSKNHFSDVDTMTVLKDTAGFTSVDNTSASTLSKTQSMPAIPSEYLEKISKAVGGPRKIPESSVSKMPRSAIIVDEWGPYDWQSPKLYPVDSSHAVPLKLKVLGPSGTWETISRRGIERLSRTSGHTGDAVEVTPSNDRIGDWELTLEYRGEATVSPEGLKRKAGQPYRFSYGRFEPAIDWKIGFFVWNDSTDPRSRNEAFSALLHSTPLLTQRSSRLDYQWYRPVIKELPLERFAFEATGVVKLDSGIYTLRTISDDGVRVWVDGTLIIDNWKPHGSTLDYAPLAGGEHNLVVQFYQADGWTEFRLDILRGTNRSPGSQ